MSESKVSTRLSETLADEVRDLIIKPRLAGFAQGFTALSDVNKAHLVMLSERSLIAHHNARDIARAMLEIEAEGPDSIPLDPAREDAYFNYEAHLMTRVGDDVGGRLHTGRSRNDVLATLDKLKCRRALMDLIDALHRARETTLAQALTYVDCIMPGYTHLQPAQPISYGFYLSGVAQALERDTRRLESTLEKINECPLGAAAFAGTVYDLDRQRTATLLGFDSYVENALDAVASRDFMLATLSDISLLAVFWSRVAQDFHVWSTPEFGLIDFPDSVASTSSIMPQKKNPIVLEYLKGRAGHIVGNLVSASMAVKGTNFTHTGDGNRESVSLFSDAVDETIRCITLMDLVLRTARPNEQAGLDHARQDFSTVTALADLIVTERDWPFRTAHHVVGAAVRNALEHGMSAERIDAKMLDAAARDQAGTSLSFSEEQIRQCLDPVSNVRARRSAGGPSPTDVTRRVQVAQDRLAQEKHRHRQRIDHYDQARQALNQATEILAGLRAA